MRKNKSTSLPKPWAKTRDPTKQTCAVLNGPAPQPPETPFNQRPGEQSGLGRRAARALEWKLRGSFPLGFGFRTWGLQQMGTREDQAFEASQHDEWNVTRKQAQILLPLSRRRGTPLLPSACFTVLPKHILQSAVMASYPHL